MDTGVIVFTGAKQGSSEWLQERIGHFTSSELHRLMTVVKREMTKEELKFWKETNPKSKATTIEDCSLLSQGALTYVLEKVHETMTGTSKDFYNDATVWGVENEPLARKWYSRLNEVEVEEVGFVKAGQSYGGSADGLINTVGGLEIKCPYKGANHLAHLLIKDQDYFKENHPDYYWQCQSNMFILNREWWDFVSFDPRIDSDAGYFQLRVYQNEHDINRLITKVQAAVEKKFELLEYFTKYKIQPDQIAAE